jgi:ABC-type branched-subunit amino acid transport system substrate-binding protein
MKTKQWSAIIGFGLALALLTAVGTLRKRKPSITIGAILPMTGNLSFFGEGNKNALSLFQRDNPDVHFDFYDSKGDPSTGVSAAKSVVDRGSRYSITNLSYIVNAVQPTFDNAKIANFTLSMDTRAERRSFFCLRLFPTYQQEMDKLREFVIKRKKKRILVLYNNVESLSYTVNSYLKSILPEGSTLIAAPYTASTTDFRNIIEKYSGQHPDVVRIVDFGDKLATILTQIQETGKLNNIPVLSGVETLLIDYKKIPPSITKRFMFTAPNLFLKKDNIVVSEYQKIFHKQPTFDALFSYDIARILVPEIRTYGYTNVDSVIRSIIAKKTFIGAAARYTIDSNGGITPEMHWAKIVNGDPTLIGADR